MSSMASKVVSTQHVEDGEAIETRATNLSRLRMLPTMLQSVENQVQRLLCDVLLAIGLCLHDLYGQRRDVPSRRAPEAELCMESHQSQDSLCAMQMCWASQHNGINVVHRATALLKSTVDFSNVCVEVWVWEKQAVGYLADKRFPNSRSPPASSCAPHRQQIDRIKHSGYM